VQEPNPPRLGFLVSMLVHLSVVLILLNRVLTAPPPPQPVAPAASPPGPAVFLPPAEVLRQLRTAPPPVRPTSPTPAATPVPTPPPDARDRISIGGPTAPRAAGPLVLRREDDLTATPRGTPRGDGSERAVPAAPPSPAAASTPMVADGVLSGGRLRLPPGIGREPSGETAPAGPPRPSSLAESLRNLERSIARSGPQGTTTGTGQQMGPLFFDPEGADFTAWVNHFKNEVYRNWIMPQAVVLGVRGHVDLEFTVERDGRVSEVRLVKSAGNPALDRAAANALVASRLWPLPADYAPPRLTIQVSFFYNEGPQGS
jgi:protein TonB